LILVPDGIICGSAGANTPSRESLAEFNLPNFFEYAAGWVRVRELLT